MFVYIVYVICSDLFLFGVLLTISFFFIADRCCSVLYCLFFFFFKQKTAYEMRISDWSSDVCSSDLRQFGADGGSGGGEGGDAGRDAERNADRFQPPKLLAHGRPDGQVAGMKARSVMPRLMGIDDDGDDLVQGERRRVDDPCPRRTMIEQGGGHQRSGLETDRSTRDQGAPAQGEEVGRAGTGADELNGHGAELSARAQLAKRSEEKARGARRRPFCVSAASAVASATMPAP